ncbi:2-oxoacid:acceptor oxidoreductase family protein, partial [Petrimonas sp.]
TEPYLNIENYPAQEVLLETIAATANHLLVNAASVAKEAGSIKSYNVVMLGAAAPYLEIAPEELERAIEIFFSRKGKEMVELNINAFRLGRANALNEQK